MELFVTTHKGEPTMTTVESTPVVEGENVMQGFCEFCWGYDTLARLCVYHPYGNRAEHTMAHALCVEKLDSDRSWTYCEC